MPIRAMLLISGLLIAGLLPLPGATPVYALHLQFDKRRPDWVLWYEGELTRAKAMGYTHVFLKFGAGTGAYRLDMGAGSSNGVDPKDLRRLVRHAHEALGLELVFEAKLFGKQRMTIGDLIEKYPGIVYSGKVKAGMGGFNDVWNPRFKLPDGRDLYQGVIGTMLDELFALWGKNPPKYFHMGWDELDKEALVMAARAEGLTPERLWAREWNRCVKLILDRGVTPVAWGDCFLSERLAKGGVVKGWKGDERFIGLKDMNGDPSWTGNASLLEGVDEIGFRDRVIMIDWHYFGGSGPGADQYPSVDYFQALGFKDVWVATWWNENGIRQFSQYGQGKKVGGYVATFWNLSLQAEAIERYEAVFDMSLPLFKNPAAILPRAEPWFARGQVPSFHCEGNQIKALLPGMKREASSTLQWRPTFRDAWGPELPLKPTSDESVWGATFPGSAPGGSLWGDVRINVEQQGKPPSHWVFCGVLETGAQPPAPAWKRPGPVPDFSCVFAGAPASSRPLLVTGGALRCTQSFNEATLGEEGMRLGPKGWASIPKNAYFWAGCREGITLEIAFTHEKELDPKGPWQGLVCMGSYNEGVRLLINEGRLEAQVAGKSGKPLRLLGVAPLQAGKSHRVRMVFDGLKNSARLIVDGKVEAELVSGEFLPLDECAFQTYPIAIGAGNGEGVSAYRNPFGSGSIQEVAVWSQPLP